MGDKNSLAGILVILFIIVTSVLSGAVSADKNVVSGDPEIVATIKKIADYLVTPLAFLFATSASSEVTQEPAPAAQESTDETGSNEFTGGDTEYSSSYLYNQIDGTLAEGKLPFLFFYAEWCGYSQKQMPILEELELEYGDSVEFIWLNVEEYPEEAEAFEVRGYPTMFLITGKDTEGYEFERIGGYTEREELIAKFVEIFGSENSASDLALHAEIDRFLAANKPVFLFFYTEWCGFCAQQKPIIDELEQEYGDEIVFIRVNADQNPEAVDEFGVAGFPTMFLITRKDDAGYHYESFVGFTNMDELVTTFNAKSDVSIRTVLQSNRTQDIRTSPINYVDYLEEARKNETLVKLLKQADKSGYKPIAFSDKIVLNNDTEVFFWEFVSEYGDSIYLVSLSSEENGDGLYLVTYNGSTVSIHKGFTAESNNSLSLLVDINDLVEIIACMGFCMDPSSIKYPIEASLSTVETQLSVSSCTAVFCGCCVGVPNPLDCGACVLLLGYSGCGVGKAMDCASGCWGSKCYFAHPTLRNPGPMPEEYCEILYKNTLYGKDEFFWDGDYCYYYRFRNGYNNNIRKCCSYMARDYLEGGIIYTDQNTGPYTSPYWDEWNSFGWKNCEGSCTGNIYYPPSLECTENGMTCSQGSTPQDAQAFCNEHGFEYGQCGEPTSPYCSADEPLTDGLKSFPGDLWCWTCSLGPGDECSEDSECNVNYLNQYCAPSCTDGGASHCCYQGQRWSEGIQQCVSKCECTDDSDCKTCTVCVGGFCEPDDTAISADLVSQGCICCDGELRYPRDPPLSARACCEDGDCDTATAEVCHEHFCLKTQGSCYYSAECAPDYWCAACAGKEPHCCPSGTRWDGTRCVANCVNECSPKKCMFDYVGNVYSCDFCSPQQIEQGLCDETSGNCYYGDPDATNSPCEHCVGEDCVNGYCESSLGCAEYKLPADHGYMDCTTDPDITCNCQDTCEGALRLYNPINFILPDQTGYLYNGCLFHGCYNCGVDDLMCENGVCMSGNAPDDVICKDDQCLPDTTLFWNDYARPETGKCPYVINDYNQKCAPASQRYTWDGEFCTDESGSQRPTPIQVDEHRWLPAIHYKKMKNYAQDINEPLCYEAKDWGCYLNDDRNFKVSECTSPVPQNFWICGDYCYDPEYYECCEGGRLVQKDQNGDGIQDHKCCILGIKKATCLDLYKVIFVNRDIVYHGAVDIVNDHQNCGGCGWTCTEVVNGACLNIERDYSHVCTGTKPQCCSGTCVEPSPVITIKELSLYPPNVIDNAEETIAVTVGYSDPYNYGKEIELNLSVYVNNSFLESKSMKLSPWANKSAYFYWEANLSAGQYELKVNITTSNNITICGNLEQNKIFIVNQKPDIALTGLVVDITNTKSGDIVPVSVALHNGGVSNTNEFITTLLVDGEFQDFNITSLQSGESKEISFNWTARLGEHTLSGVADALPGQNGLIPETNELNNNISQVVDISDKGNSTPTLTYAFVPGYFFDGVEPDIGDESTAFDYQVAYTDYDNDAPATENPKVWIDINGDGDYNDSFNGFVEGAFSMSEVNLSDDLYTNGKLYSYVTQLPAGENLTYKFEAVDATGRNATGDIGVHSGPYVLPLPLTLTISSPENKTYASTSVRLKFVVEPEGVTLDWIAYSLDGGENVTIEGNTTIYGLSSGNHTMVVYVTDVNGNSAKSLLVHFTIHAADITGDGTVNIFDLQQLAWAFLSHPGDGNWNSAADLNCDQVVNIFDLQIMAWNFMTHY